MKFQLEIVPKDLEYQIIRSEITNKDLDETILGNIKFTTKQKAYKYLDIIDCSISENMFKKVYFERTEDEYRIIYNTISIL